MMAGNPRSVEAIAADANNSEVHRRQEVAVGIHVGIPADRLEWQPRSQTCRDSCSVSVSEANQERDRLSREPHTRRRRDRVSCNQREVVSDVQGECVEDILDVVDAIAIGRLPYTSIWAVDRLPCALEVGWHFQ